jgi:hypothetical protein
MVLLIATLSFLSLTSPARGEVIHTFQAWDALIIQTRPKDAASGPAIWFDAQARRGADATIGILRPGFGWYLGPRVSLWAGYLAQGTFRDAAPDTLEHRPWQQAQFTLGPQASTWTLRTRLEQRFLHNDADLGLRVRQLVRLQHKLGRESAWVLWDEIFLGLNETSWGQPAGFDQNRIFVGPAWLPRRQVRLEGGYLSAFLVRPGVTTLVHSLSLNAFLLW